jgi:EAL domain-containing protein (putative c-di-GMP-specific phosphodiesterase class I)
VEGLIRWTHPTLGRVSIEPFIRLLEQTGAIRRLTEWVIARAVIDRATLAAAGHEVTIWVNLSGLLLPDAAFTARALELIEGSGGGIGLEITETAVIENPDRAMANLAAFTAAGIRIAIDDYGSGLSSLAYLKQLPADELKIDRLFIKELVNSHRDPLLVRSSIDLAHALEMEVTAEGVDDPMALSLLRIMGCDMVQGYLICEPVPLARLHEVLKDEELLERLGAPTLPHTWRAA